MEKILDESHKRTKGIRDKIAPQILAETTRLNGEIRAKLTPEQAKKFDESMKPRPPRKGEDKGRKKQKMPGKNAPGSNSPSASVTNPPPAPVPPNP